MNFLDLKTIAFPLLLQGWAEAAYLMERYSSNRRESIDSNYMRIELKWDFFWLLAHFQSNIRSQSPRKSSGLAKPFQSFESQL